MTSYVSLNTDVNVPTLRNKRKTNFFTFWMPLPKRAVIQRTNPRIRIRIQDPYQCHGSGTLQGWRLWINSVAVPDGSQLTLFLNDLVLPLPVLATFVPALVTPAPTRKRTKEFHLKGPNGQIRSAREWYRYHLLGLGQDIPRKTFIFLDFLNGVQKLCSVSHPKLPYLINNSFGRSAGVRRKLWWFCWEVRLSNKKICKSAALPAL